MTTTYEAVRNELRSTVAFIGNTGRRAFDAVVFELADGHGQVHRTMVVRTGSNADRPVDSSRTQRLARRLRAMGFRQNWAAMGHPQDSVRGTIRMFKAAA